jgi:hypothetical protein
MTSIRMIFVAAFAAFAAIGCTSTLDGRQLAEYCSDPNKAGKDLCAVNREIESTRAALAVTDRTANEAKTIALSADAEAKAVRAMVEGGIQCETKTVRRSSTGTCGAGYTLVGCTQTRFTSAAGGTTVMRSINNESCRFASRVLEMQVRCCSIGAAAIPASAEEPATTRPDTPTS